MRILALCALLGVLLVSGVRAGQRTERRTLGDRNVAIWMPTSTGQTAAHLVLFSHGFHGNSTQSRALMTAMAAAGYLVVAPDHRDAIGRGRLPALWPVQRFGDPQKWSAATYRDRAEDLAAVYRALCADPHLGPRFDHHRVALVGHSLGGYTVLGLAGAWPQWHDLQLHPQAVVALSPYCTPFMRSGTLGQLAAPVMYQGGTRDVGITPSLVRPGGAYSQSPQPKFLVEFDTAGHLSWTNLRTDQHLLIERYTVAFLKHYLEGKDPDAILRHRLPGVKTLRYACEFGGGTAR